LILKNSDELMTIHVNNFQVPQLNNIAYKGIVKNITSSFSQHKSNV